MQFSHFNWLFDYMCWTNYEPTEDMPKLNNNNNMATYVCWVACG